MGSIFSYKAEDRKPIYQNQSFDYNAPTNSEQVLPQEEENDKTKEDETKIPVEEHPEKAPTNSEQVLPQEEENDKTKEIKIPVEEHPEKATNQVKRPVPQQKIQTPTPASSGNPENSPAAPRGESTHKKPSCCAMSLLGAILIIGLVAIVLYILCYFRDNERYLQFFGHMSYRPSLLLPPLIWLAALVKIKNGDHRNRHTSWDKLFECTEGICNTILNAITVDRSTIIAFFIYLLLPVGALKTRPNHKSPSGKERFLLVATNADSNET